LQLSSTAYEWKIMLEWGSVCFCSPIMLLKNFNFFYSSARVCMITRPRHRGSGMAATPKHCGLAAMLDPSDLGLTVMRDPNKQQTKIWQLYALVIRREKRKKNTNNRVSTAIQPWYVYTRCFILRWHGCASSYTMDGQIWPPGSISLASSMIRVPPTRWGA
jgi:hypothetical protein